ncbi:MAG: SDR family NAD(P)-dependent oxidoreductase [Chloroflexi bacterium]|nr:MAG: SDR family NAD(P)-dependent oxidoreductase [Chloroflexota bacterium]MBL1193038.1 SDR family oxidoreductase [Chloroflexota bacterium]NOH10331.1 SDR family oxidoreductase [Chloroflexota bacterium]
MGSLEGKTILITGAAKRVGREMALAIARQGGNLVIHYNSSDDEAQQTKADIEAQGVKAHLIKADLNDHDATATIIPQALEFGPLYGLVHNASIYAPVTIFETDLASWNLHMNVHATSAFILSKAFAEAVGKKEHARIVTMLDWRVLRPIKDHFPYTISKATLAAMTESLAASFAPNITVNGIALGAILPPTDQELAKGIKDVPANRWARLEEVTETLLFLLAGPEFITGEIIHVDGGRHLV